MMFSAETGLSETLLGPGLTLSSLASKQVGVTCQVSFFLKKVLELIGGGSVIKSIDESLSTFMYQLRVRRCPHNFSLGLALVELVKKNLVSLDN